MDLRAGSLFGGEAEATSRTVSTGRSSQLHGPRESNLCLAINTRQGLASASIVGGSSLSKTRSAPCSPLARSFLPSPSPLREEGTGLDSPSKSSRREINGEMSHLHWLRMSDVDDMRQSYPRRIDIEHRGRSPLDSSSSSSLQLRTPLFEKGDYSSMLISLDDVLEEARAYTERATAEQLKRNGSRGTPDSQYSTRWSLRRHRTPSPSSRSRSSFTAQTSPRFSPAQSTSVRKPYADRGTSPSPTSPTNMELRRFPPPFVPTQDVSLLLMHLEHLLEELDGLQGKSQEGSSRCLHDLVDIHAILRHHRVDVRLEELRSILEIQIDEECVGFAERARWNSDADGSWRTDMALVDSSDPKYRVFGQPLYMTQLFASRVACMGGLQHDLPIVVYACVEELYRTGMTSPGLFRSPPDRTRHKELIKIFDHGPLFGRNVSLAKESTADICALLRSYIDRIPLPLWHESMFDALWILCVAPSINREKDSVDELKRNEKKEFLRTNARPTSLIQTQHRSYGPSGFETDPSFRPSLRRRRSATLDSAHDPSFFRTLGGTLDIAAALHVSDEDLEAEASREITAARLLFRLLPRAHLSVLAYLCAFFSQVPLCSHANGVGMEDIARLFGVPIFLGVLGNTKRKGESDDVWMRRKDQARTMMAWLVRRWSLISVGLFTPLEDLIHDQIAAGEEVADSATMPSLSDSDSSSLSSLSTRLDSLCSLDEFSAEHERQSSTFVDDPRDEKELEDIWNQYSEQNPAAEVQGRYIDDIVRWDLLRASSKRDQ